MPGSHPSITIGQPMDKHISTRRNAPAPRRLTIARARVRNVDRLVKLAACVTRIENIGSLRSLMVALLSLWSNRISAQRHLVRLNYFPLAKQLQRALFLEYDHAISM